MLIEGQLVDRFSQSRHMNTEIYQSVTYWIVTSCGLQNQHVEALPCMCSVLPPSVWSDEAVDATFHTVLLPWLTQHPPTNTQNLVSAKGFSPLQLQDCRIIYFDNSCEETAGTTLGFVDEKSWIDILFCIVLPRGKLGQPPCHIIVAHALGGNCCSTACSVLPGNNMASLLLGHPWSR